MKFNQSGRNIDGNMPTSKFIAGFFVNIDPGAAAPHARVDILAVSNKSGKFASARCITGIADEVGMNIFFNDNRVVFIVRLHFET